MADHLFVDESKSRGYVLAAVRVAVSDLQATRKELAGMVLPGQRRLHFTKESDSRRRRIIDQMVSLRASVVIFRTGAAVPEARARQACLAEVARYAIDQSAEMLVIERDESLVVHDRRTLFQAMRATGPGPRVRYEFRGPHEESLLWLPDAFAWCWTKGGRWRKRIGASVTRVSEADS